MRERVVDPAGKGVKRKRMRKCRCPCKRPFGLSSSSEYLHHSAERVCIGIDVEGASEDRAMGA